MSLSGRKINKQIKLIKQMPPDIKRTTIVANMNVKLYWWPLIHFTRYGGNRFEGTW